MNLHILRCLLGCVWVFRSGRFKEGLIDSVERQLMSGKEATVYVVRCDQEIRCAKVNKEASQRSFRQAASYQEGRKVKNSRQARAMEKGTRYGRKMQEEVWQNAEVDALYRPAAAGVRVPKPYICFEGVLLMELVTPQAIDAAANTEAGAMLERDVNNLRNFFSVYAPELASTQYGKEIWQLYGDGLLTPDSVLTGEVEIDTRPADVGAVMHEIALAEQEEHEKQMRLQQLLN